MNSIFSNCRAWDEQQWATKLEGFCCDFISWFLLGEQMKLVCLSATFQDSQVYVVILRPQKPTCSSLIPRNPSCMDVKDFTKCDVSDNVSVM